MSTAVEPRKDREPVVSPPTPGRDPWFSALVPDRYMRRFFQDFDRMFDDLGSGWRSARAPEWLQTLWSPRIDAFERDGQFVVRADLPGLTKDDVTLEVTDETVTIDGERRLENKEEREGYYRAERHEGRFHRRLPVPEGAVTDQAAATFRNGVLELRIPMTKKPATPKPRRVAIE